MQLPDGTIDPNLLVRAGSYPNTNHDTAGVPPRALEGSGSHTRIFSDDPFTRSIEPELATSNELTFWPATIPWPALQTPSDEPWFSNDAGDVAQHDDYFNMYSQLASLDEFSQPVLQPHENPVSGIIVWPETLSPSHFVVPLQQWQLAESPAVEVSGSGFEASMRERLDYADPAGTVVGSADLDRPSLMLFEPMVQSLTARKAPLEILDVGKSEVPAKRHLAVRRPIDKTYSTLSSKPPLTFVRETGDGQRHHLLTRQAKGRRRGPLPESVKQAAKQTRQNKSICIRCKKDHQPCARELDGPCSRCLDLGLTAIWPQPCIKASFLGIVESGTSNYISQRAVNHPTLDGSRRIRIDLPETLDLDALLGLLQATKGAYNIRVRQADSPIYVLNLAKCYEYLSAIRKKQGGARRDQRKFIDEDILNINHWVACVDGCNPLRDLMSCLIIWGNMPSRQSYSIIRRVESQPFGVEIEQDMDVEDPLQQKTIIMAAQLSRIVCRKLEVEAYTYLQQVLNDWSKLSNEELCKFVRGLGMLLLTLRWRVSWWILLGDGGMTPDDKGKEAFAERVKTLCRVLYFYHCMMRRKLEPGTARGIFHGKWSTYPDTAQPVFEKFPQDESVKGFEAWMEDGERLIDWAGVEGKLAVVGLRYERLSCH